jgi:hypothetical protein
MKNEPKADGFFKAIAIIAAASVVIVIISASYFWLVPQSWQNALDTLPRWVALPVCVGLVLVFEVLDSVNKAPRKEQAVKEEEPFEQEPFEGETFKEKPPYQSEMYYARILCLSGKVTLLEIKKSYHKLMKEYHPDKIENMGDKLKSLAAEETKKINEAYEYFKNKYSTKVEAENEK